MDVVIYMLFAFILFSLFIKLSFWEWKYIALFGIFLGIFILVVYPSSTEQSQTTFKALLNSNKTLSNMAVFVILEATLLISYCILLLLQTEKNKTSKYAVLLKFYPGFLILPILFYALTQSFFTFTGTDFFTIALIMSIITALAVPIISLLIKKLLPEKEQRIEFLLLLNIFIIILGLIATTNAEMVYQNEETKTEMSKLILAFSIFASLFTLGYFFHQLKWWIKNKKSNI